MVRTKHRIGGYRVIAPIGAGGFATVYRALDESTETEVAIKVLAENHSLVAATRRRFVDEVNLLAAIDSPSIAKIYKVGETETGQPYMVLELADRGDLRRRLEEIRSSRQVLNRADLTMLAHHLYDALNTLHEADIVHRDVSPNNILIRTRQATSRRGASRNGEITLLEPGERFLLADLGHAKDLVQASGFTAGGGTRGFASPEQLDDITVVDRRADIFSATAIIEWAAHDGEFAIDLEPFFDVGLAAEPDDRFDTMADWHAAFCEAMGAAETEPGSGRLAKIRERVGRVTVPVAELPLSTRVAIGATAVLVSGTLSYVIIRQGETDTATGIGSSLEGDGSGELPGSVAESDPSSSATSVPADPLIVGSSDIAAAFEGSPRAELVTPEDGATVDGDLVISGNAVFSGGLSNVEMMIENIENDTHWNPEANEFQGPARRFRLDVTGDDMTDAAFATIVPDEKLLPGRYRIEVWARGLDNQGDPRGDSHTVTVS